MSTKEDDKESKEPDYDDDKEQLEEEQEKKTEEIQPFDPIVKSKTCDIVVIS